MISKLILLFILTLSLGLNISEHGKEEVKKKNAWYSFTSYIIFIVLLYFSGFFNQI